MKTRTSVIVMALLLTCVVVAQEEGEGEAPVAEREREREVNARRGGDTHHHYYGGGPVGGSGYGYGYGYGYPQRGFSGGLASGVGEGRLSTAQAAETYADTAHQVQENHNFAVNSYYANKDAHDQYVAAHRKKPITAEQRAKFAKATEPGRLSNAQFDRSTNVIHWPALLRDPEFTKERQALDHLFHDRTPDNSGAASDNYLDIKKECEAMNKTLGAKLRNDKLPTLTFLACEHFIKSLSYEGSFAATK